MAKRNPQLGDPLTLENARKLAQGLDADPRAPKTSALELAEACRRIIENGSPTVLIPSAAFRERLGNKLEEIAKERGTFGRYFTNANINWALDWIGARKDKNGAWILEG